MKVVGQVTQFLYCMISLVLFLVFRSRLVEWCLENGMAHSYSEIEFKNLMKTYKILRQYIITIDNTGTK